MPRFVPPRKPVDTQEAIKLYNQGAFLVEIAKKNNISPRTLKRRFKDAGFKPYNNTYVRDKKDHYNWSGENASYSSCHKRLRRANGSPKKCDWCGTTDPSKKYDWANMTGKFIDLNDYQRLCKDCHLRYDILLNRLRIRLRRKLGDKTV